MVVANLERSIVLSPWFLCLCRVVLAYLDAFLFCIMLLQILPTKLNGCREGSTAPSPTGLLLLLILDRIYGWVATTYASFHQKILYLVQWSAAT